MDVLVIDCDYKQNKKGEPIIRIFGKKVGTSDEGKDIVLHARGFKPYCYANVAWIAEEEVKTALKGYFESIEKVKKYQPIGYQPKKPEDITFDPRSEMLKIVLFDPKSTPEVRKILEEMDIQVMEADIPFKNRFMLDIGMSGMSVIQFDEIDKQMNNYGLNVEELYMVDYKEIYVTDKIVNIEY